MNNEIPVLTTSWPWNPNHRYRFYVIGLDHVPRWLFTIRFSNKDQSLYLTPLYEREYSVQSMGSGQDTHFKQSPGSDFHLSLHESGIVNLTTSDGRVRLREHLEPKQDVRHVVTFQINSTKNLPATTLEKINNPKGAHLYLPIVGLPVAPLMLTVYCAKEDANWSPPSLGNTMMTHYKTEMKAKDYNFHFIQWQDLVMQKGVGDIALSFGGNNDSLYNL